MTQLVKDGIKKSGKHQVYTVRQVFESLNFILIKSVTLDDIFKTKNDGFKI